MNEPIEKHLLEKIVPFWTSLVDVRFGGYYGYVGNDLRVRRGAPKGLVQQSRMLWTFSALENHYHDGRFRPYMETAWNFLKTKMYDFRNEGFFWTLTREGKPIDSRKVVYGQGFAIYALAEYAKAGGDAEALSLARRLFGILEAKAWDPEAEGYREEFSPEWIPDGCRMLGDGIFGCVFTVNTALHLLEAFTNLYSAFPDPAVKAAVLRLLALLKNRMYDPGLRSLHPYFDRDYRSLGTLRSFGHDIETAWLMDQAVRTAGLEDPAYAEMTSALAEAVYEDGYNGAYVDNSRADGKTDREEVWWVQAESLTGFYNHFQKTGKGEFRLAVNRLWQTVMNDLVDPREGGEWFWSVDEHKRPSRSHGMAELWKCPYHNVRCLLQLMERMGSQ